MLCNTKQLSMRIIIPLILMIQSINTFSQNSEYIYNKQSLVEKIISVYKTIETFENKYAGGRVDKYEDSLNIANYYLMQLFSDKWAAKLSDSDFKQIKANTEIKILFSMDMKVAVITWSIFNSYQIPMCSNIIFYNGNTMAVSLNGAGDSDFGENVQTDKILQIKLNDKTCYILTGSNKCGNLCIQEIASLYYISYGNIKKCSNSFFNGKKYFSDIKFDYQINDKIKVEPEFKIQGNSLVYPKFNKGNDKIIGRVGVGITCHCFPSGGK